MVGSKLSQTSSGKQHCFSNLFSSWRQTKQTNEVLLSLERLRLYRRFTFKELRAATNNFGLGIHNRDSFATAYKGYIDDGHRYPVSIKRFGSSATCRETFLNELKLLSDLPYHPNIISLVGYCFDGSDYMLIVYEYMSGGTLWDRLHDMKDSLLPWKARLQICIGVVRGLECLQTGNRLIIHRDIKSNNILVNQNWIAKISNFDLSELVPASFSASEPDRHISTTAVLGTFGYLDPEYYLSRQVTLKSDVYSFGVVLFEVLSGRKPSDTTTGSTVSVIQWARECMVDGKLDEIIDPHLKGEISPDCLKAFLDLAYHCTKQRANERPPVAAVAKRLELTLLLQECTEFDIPFSPLWLKSIRVPPVDEIPPADELFEIQDSEYSDCVSELSRPR